jgi:hypothetical protein
MLGLAGIGCANRDGAEAPKQAILAVLRENNQANRDSSVNFAGKNWVPSQAAQTLKVYLSKADAIDLSKCPADFCVAYRQYTRASRGLQGAFQRMPDKFLAGGVDMGFTLNAEQDARLPWLKKDIYDSIGQMLDAWKEVEKIGAKYDAAL